LLAFEIVDFQFRLAFADDQIRTFYLMRDRACRSEAKDALGYLNYVENYYPSGTKQKEGTRLDSMVERVRAAVVIDIEQHISSQEVVPPTSTPRN
jgi:hypothetical protein